MGRLEENLNENYVLALPLKQDCEFHDKELAVHENVFDDVFRLYCTNCEEFHEFEYADES